MTEKLSKRDWEALSAYLDDQLKPRERARLEARLAVEPALQTGLRELDETRAMLRRVPAVRAPRNFTLSPEMAGQRPFSLPIYPALQFATVVATFLFVLVFAGELSGVIVPQTSFQAEPMRFPEIEPAVIGATSDEIEGEKAAPPAESQRLEAELAEELEGEGRSVPVEEPETVTAAEEPMAVEQGEELAPAEDGFDRQVTVESQVDSESLAASGLETPSEDFYASPSLETKEAPVMEEAGEEAVLENIPSAQPTATPEPEPTPQPLLVATPEIRLEPNPTPALPDEPDSGPVIPLPPWVKWIFGGLALSAGALTLLLRRRQF